LSASPERTSTARKGTVSPYHLRLMSRIFRLSIDEETLTDELFAFVVDPRSTRYQRRVVTELKVIAPGMIPVMEMMILDGVDERRHVRDYVAAVLGGDADRDVYYVT
jgi:hypothetical protein